MQSQKYYDSISVGYNNLYGEEQKRKYLHMPFDEVKGKKALDLGCGTGLLIPLIKDKFEMIVGVDSSFNMLKLCPKHKNVFYVKADATNLPLINDSFDYVFSFSVFQDVRDKDEFLKELRRVCKSKAIVSVLNKNKSLLELKTLFEKFFVVEEIVEGEKDFILFLKK